MFLYLKNMFFIVKPSCAIDTHSKTVKNWSVAAFKVPEVHMCPFGDIKDIPDSCVGNFGFFIVGSSCAIQDLSKMVLNLSVAAPSTELQSVTYKPTNQPTNQPTNAR